MSFTLVHSRKVLIASPQVTFVGKICKNTPSPAGILAVSVLSGIVDGNECALPSLSDAEVLQIQVVSVSNIDKDDVSFVSGMDKAPIAAYSARFTIEQISADLKIFDDSAIRHSRTIIGTAPSSASDEKVDYLLSLLKSVSSKLELELGCFLVLELISGMDHSIATPRLLISIKERLKNGIVRILWSTILSGFDAGNITNSDTKGIDALFQLGLDLSDHYDQTLRKMDSLKEHHLLLERDRDAWKDTAEKLEGLWEDEKSVLFHNFCTLYSGKKEYDDGRIAELQQEIDKLKQQLQKASTLGAASTTSVAGRKSVLPDFLQNEPNDDHHRLPYDDETVRLLARGERVPMVTVKTEDYGDTDAYAASEKQSKKRQNPVSGATEYQDADEALQDILQSSPDHKKLKGNSTSTQSQNRRPRVLEVASAAMKQTRVKELPRPSSERGSDSDTGSDSDFIDRDIQAQIMADLEALRKI
jgi:hypothetical protein